MRCNSLIMKDKLLIGVAIISSAALLEGCGKTETTNELRILYQCADVEDFDNGDVLCRLELTNVVVSRYTNVLGKAIQRVQSQTPLRDIQGAIAWNLPAGARLADNNVVVHEFGSGCQNGYCTANGNPTAFWLPIGSNVIGVSGTGTVNGKTVDLATSVPAVVIDISDWQCPDCSGNRYTCFC